MKEYLVTVSSEVKLGQSTHFTELETEAQMTKH